MFSDSGIILSVVFITYNQAEYVEKALDSILMQETDFRYEILIGDDASTDNTPAILRKYKSRYPDKIRLILRKKNLGATKNAYQLFRAAKGRYIAGLEGDDYWISKSFLQNQVDYLEQNPNYIATCGRCKVVDREGVPYPDNHDYRNRDFWKFDKNTFILKDFEEWKMPGHISALVYRNYYGEPYHDEPASYRFSRMVGDRTIILNLVLRGDIYCYEDYVTTYRFVENTCSGNWMSVQSGKNKRFHEYRLICAYEEYTQKIWNVNLNMTQLKKNKIAAAAIVWMLNKSFDNTRALFGIIMYERKPITATRLAIMACKEKRYWIRKGQPEHRVMV